LSRILVDLPNTENRVKILRVILAEEELEEGFDYEKLSRMTDGYSGSDLKVVQSFNLLFRAS
jgi:ATP-dependent 26S proteasome regulatory subunit